MALYRSNRCFSHSTQIIGGKRYYSRGHPELFFQNFVNTVIVSSYYLHEENFHHIWN